MASWTCVQCVMKVPCAIGDVVMLQCVDVWTEGTAQRAGVE